MGLSLRERDTHPTHSCLPNAAAVRLLYYHPQAPPHIHAHGILSACLHKAGRLSQLMDLSCVCPTFMHKSQQLLKCTANDLLQRFSQPGMLASRCTTANISSQLQVLHLDCPSTFGQPKLGNKELFRPVYQTDAGQLQTVTKQASGQRQQGRVSLLPALKVVRLHHVAKRLLGVAHVLFGRFGEGDVLEAPQEGLQPWHGWTGGVCGAAEADSNLSGCLLLVWSPGRDVRDQTAKT